MTRFPPRRLPTRWLVALAIAGTGPAFAQSNQPPAALFAAQQARNTFDLQFDASASSDPDGSITVYSWDFGDGTTGEGATPLHRYAKAGKYSVKLTVSDNSPVPARTTLLKTVTVDAPPVVVYSWKQYQGQLIIMYSAGGTIDPDGYIASHKWDFGDGTSGSGRDTSHAYSKAGDYNVTLTSTDNFGNWVAKNFTVTVTPLAVNAAPVAVASTSALANTFTIAFDGSASSDPDGSIVAHAWNFGDGTSGSGPKTSHTYAGQGQYAATLTVRDNLGVSRTVAVPVTVTPLNQVPRAWASAAVSQGTLAVAFDGAASADPDGSVVSYAWDFGDGSGGTGAAASHTYQAPGEYMARLTVTDNQGASNTYALPLAVGVAPAYKPWVSGYYAGWLWQNYLPQNVDMGAMSHMLFGRVAPGGPGGTMGGQPGEVIQAAGTAHAPRKLPPGLTIKSVEDFMVERAHATGVKAILMLGGRKDGPGFVASTAATVRAAFIDNLLNYMVAHDYDGVDVNWLESLDDPAVQAQLTAFLRELRAAAALRPRYAAPNKPVTISFATYWLNMNYEKVPAWRVEVAGLVDQFNIMTYSMSYGHGGWKTWHFAPLFGQDGYHPADISSTVNAYRAAGIDAAKIGIGIGFYGLSYAPPATAPNQTPTTFSGNDLEWSYANLANGGFLAAGTYTWDPVAQAGYRSYEGGYTGQAQYNTSISGYLSYEDPASIFAKGRWVRDNRLGGAMIWNINYGSPDALNNPLLEAVKQSFLLGSVTAPPTARVSARFAGGTELRYEFDGTASTDANNQHVPAYAWDFGDGATATVAQPAHTYAAEGKYTVRLTVTDAQGVSSTVAVVVHVAFPPPPDVMPPLEVIEPVPGAAPWVMGYYAGWSWDASIHPRYVDYTAMTHLAFARVAPGSGTLGGNPGDVVPGGGSAHNPNTIEGRSAEDYLVWRAHGAGAKAILMIGGVGDGNGFLRSTAPAVRPTFVKNLLDYLEKHDYDGVEVDWEDVLDTELAQFRLTAFIADLRAAAKLRARWQDGRKFIITAPGYALNMNYNTVADWKVQVASIVDQYNLMTYGMGYNATGWVTTTFAPLGGWKTRRPMDISSSIQAYVDAGVPRKKLGLGIGFYGMCYSLPATDIDQDVTPVDSWDVNWTYTKLHRKGFLANGTYKWVDDAKMGYRSYPDGFNGGEGKTCGMVSYEDEASIAAKGAWARHPDTAIGGAIIWLINHGTTNGTDNPLLDAVKRAFMQ